jgi:hypothetical protein
MSSTIDRDQIYAIHTGRLLLKQISVACAEIICALPSIHYSHEATNM